MGFDNLRVKNGFLDFDLPIPELIRKNVSCPESHARRQGHAATSSYRQPELEPVADEPDNEHEEPEPVPEMDIMRTMPECITFATTPRDESDWVPMTPEPVPMHSFQCPASQTFYLPQLDAAAYDHNLIPGAEALPLVPVPGPSFFVPYAPFEYEQQQGCWTWPHRGPYERSWTWSPGDEQHQWSDQHEGRSTPGPRNPPYQIEIAPQVQAPPALPAASSQREPAGPSQRESSAPRAIRQQESTKEEETPPIKKFQCTYFIGIEDEPAFHVAKRVLGPNGRYLKAITQTLRGTRVRLRGNGSKATPAAQDNGPMHLRLSAARYDTFCNAKAMIEAELHRVYREYFKFCGKVAEFTLVENPENDALMAANK